MTTLGSRNFQLINTNDEYIEFVVSYALDLDYYVASGIGWMSNSAPKYYLRLLRLNGKLVAETTYKNARIALRNSSYRFKDKNLEMMVLGSIENIFRKIPSFKQINPSAEDIRLKPRLPSKR